MGPARAALELADLGVDAVSLALLYHGGQILSLAGDDPEFIFPPQGRPLWTLNPDHLPGALRGRAPVPFLQELRTVLAAQGIRLRAWTVSFHDAVGLAPIRNAAGQDIPHAPCPVANRGYLRSVVESLAALNLVDAVELEAAGFMLPFHGAHHEISGVRITPLAQLLFGLCFCPACKRMMLQGGVDGALVQHQVRDDLGHLVQGQPPAPTLDAYLDARPDVARVLRLREDAVAAGIAEAAGAFPGPVAVIAPSRHAETRLATLEGLHVSTIRGALTAQPDAEWVSLAYGDLTVGLEDLRTAFEAGWDPDHVVAGITLIEAGDPSLDALLRRVDALLAAGARRFSFYNFGILPQTRRDSLRTLAARVRARA